MEKPGVFISHSARAAAWARLFAQALKERGVTSGSTISTFVRASRCGEAVESGMRGSDVLVSLVDPDQPAKPNLFFEIGAGMWMGKQVVSIVPKSLDPDSLPLDVRLRRYLIRESPKRTAEELSNTLQAASCPYEAVVRSKQFAQLRNGVALHVTKREQDPLVVTQLAK
jgi:hypothetical protein